MQYSKLKQIVKLTYIILILFISIYIGLLKKYFQKKNMFLKK